MVFPNHKKFILPILVALFICTILIPVQLFVDFEMLLFERFFEGGGWLEICLISTYGAIVAYHMQMPHKVAKWRIRTWSVFTIFFFSQLILGIFVSDTFLLSGKLHLPIPMMILGGPIYRAQFSIMTLLFLSTIILTGPAWCSHLCYFGAIDGLFSASKKRPSKIKILKIIKPLVVVLIIITTLAFRFLGVSNLTATIAAITFGLAGIAVMIAYSRKKGQMLHCINYCPIGTIVNYTKVVNPFRLKIDNNCTQCMKCTATCRYNALSVQDINNKKPAHTCTLCGDCLTSCHSQSIHYKFFGLSHEKARYLYLFLSISLHAIFMAMGRI